MKKLCWFTQLCSNGKHRCPLKMLLLCFLTHVCIYRVRVFSQVTAAANHFWSLWFCLYWGVLWLEATRRALHSTKHVHCKVASLLTLEESTCDTCVHVFNMHLQSMITAVFEFSNVLLCYTKLKISESALKPFKISKRLTFYESIDNTVIYH